MLTETKIYSRALAKQFDCEHKVPPTEADMFSRASDRKSPINDGHCFGLCNYIVQFDGSLRASTASFDENKSTVIRAQLFIEELFKNNIVPPDKIKDSIFSKIWTIEHSSHVFYQYPSHNPYFLFDSILEKVASSFGVWFLHISGKHTHGILFINEAESGTIFLYEPTYGVFFSPSKLKSTQVKNLSFLCNHHFSVMKSHIFNPAKFHILFKPTATIIKNTKSYEEITKL